MAQLVGRAKITVNGTFVDTFKGVTFNPGGAKRNPQVTAFKVHYSEELAPATLEIEKAVNKGDSIKTLDLASGTIIIEFDTGQTYVMKNAFRLDPADITDDGKSKVSFNSDPAEEIL